MRGHDGESEILTTEKKGGGRESETNEMNNLTKKEREKGRNTAVKQSQVWCAGVAHKTNNSESGRKEVYT